MTHAVRVHLPKARLALENGLESAELAAALSAELPAVQNALPLERGLELGGWPEFIAARVLRSEDRAAGQAALVEVQFREVLAGGCPAGIVSNERALLFWLTFEGDTACLALVAPDSDRIDD